MSGWLLALALTEADAGLALGFTVVWLFTGWVARPRPVPASYPDPFRLGAAGGVALFAVCLGWALGDLPGVCVTGAAELAAFALLIRARYRAVRRRAEQKELPHD